MRLLQELFGSYKVEIWRQLSEEIGARYVDRGFWKGDKVQATHGPWTITLDKHVVHNRDITIVYTRMRAPYVNPDGFRFTVYRKSLFSEIAKWFGMQDLQVGYEPFDQDFILKSNQASKLQALFSNSRIRDLITMQPEIMFSVNRDNGGLFSPDLPEGVDELCFLTEDIIQDVDRLKLLYELFGETLDQLCRIGSADATTPNFTF